MPVTADLGFIPDTSPPDLGFVPDKAAPQTDVGFVPDKYPGGLTSAEWQRVLTLVPQAAKPIPDDLLGSDIQRENARQAALDQPFAAVGPGGKIFQETPQNDPEANTAEFAKLWQVPGDLASAVAADSVAQGTAPITHALYGKDSTPPWVPINTVVALQNAFRNTSANPNPQPLPIDTDYAQLSQQHPVLATTAKISRSVTASAPLLAVGGAPAWAGRLMALGFSAQMIANAGSAAQTLGTELGKNPEDRDNDKISSATAELVQDFGFAPFAGLHGAKDIVEGYADEPMDAVRQLSDQLQNAPIVGPAATADQGGAAEANVSDVLPSQSTERPKVENLAAAVQDLQDTLRGKLPAQEQQTVNAPTDRADEIIRNVFPGAARAVEATGITSATSTSKLTPVASDEPSFSTSGENDLTPSKSQQIIQQAIYEKHAKAAKIQAVSEGGYRWNPNDIRIAQSTFRILSQKHPQAFSNAAHDADFYQTQIAQRLRVLAKQHGSDVGFYKGDGATPQGFYYAGKIWRRSNRTVPDLIQTFEHEMTHHRDSGPVVSALKNDVDLNSPAAQRIVTAYNAYRMSIGRPPLTEDAARKEIVAPFLAGDTRYGDLITAFNNPDAAIRLAKDYHVPPK